jgi:TRAP-type C4-dicarboxylate transport system permease small subunit
LKAIIRVIDRWSGVGAGLCAVLLCISWAINMIEIVLRGGFNSTLLITDEYSGYLMCAITFCALSYTLREKGHIRVTLLHKVVTGRGRHYLDFFCFMIGFLFSIAITIYAAQYFYDSLINRSQSMQISETYLAIPQFFIPLGLFSMTLQFFGEMLKTILVIKGDVAGVKIAQESEELGR